MSEINNQNSSSQESKVKASDNNVQRIYIKENKTKGSNIFLVLIVALISGVLGSVITVITLKYAINPKSSENNIVSLTDTKYEIEKVENPVVAIAKEAGPSIVGIEVESITQGIFGNSSSSSEGSGIVYSEDGYIVTNYHVVEDAINDTNSKIYVTLPDSEDSIEARIVGGDETTDLAVIKIEKTGLKCAKFGDSSNLNVGEMAVAIGNPLGQEFAGSVTVGYISALNRKVTTDGRTYKLIQTDAAINPGNSGGALVNSNGEVIGINTVKIASSSIGTSVEGLGFAIPSNDAKPIIEELIKNKKIVRPYIGISGINIDYATARRNNIPEGVYVADVVTNSPASKAGIQKGDVIIGIEGKDITTMEELNEVKNTKSIGDKVTLKIYRQDGEIEVSVTLESDDTDNN